MTDATKLNEMWAHLESARAHIRARPAESREPALGDVYLWAPPNELGLDWVVVNDHPDNPALVYVVPADGHPLAGLGDVVVREAGRERISLRCGRGAWVRRDELVSERRYRVLDSHHTTRAQEKVRQIVAGPFDGSSAAWEDEADPDYDAWMAEVTNAVLGVTHRDPRRPITLAEKEFIPWTVRLRQEQPADKSLAAAGPRDKFAHLIAPPPGELTVLAGPLPWAGPGELRVVRAPTGVVIVFRATSPAEPPLVVSADPTGDWIPMVWDSGTDLQAFAPWSGEQVRLRVGTGESAEEVIVHKS